MHSSRFFWRLYAATAALVLLTAASVGAIALSRTEHALLQEKERGLRDACVAMAPEAMRLFRGELDAKPADVVERLMGTRDTRVTFIAPDGRVLADTHEDPARMDNHIDRPEVQEALAGEFGVSTRPSNTVRERLFYVALATRDSDGRPVGVVRLSRSIAGIDAELARLRRSLILVGLACVAVALLIGAYIAVRLNRPLVELTRAAENLRAGNYDTRLEDLPDDEFGILGDALNRLGKEVTERIREVTSEEARFRAMLAGMVEGVVAVDDEDRVTFSNRAAREVLGAGRIDGQRLWEVVRVAELDALLHDARANDTAAGSELAFADPTGRDVILDAEAHRFLVEGKAHVVIVLHDITELRRLERIRRDFVANVSHELKTPLTSIRGYVEALLDGAIDDERNNRRFLGKIQTNVERLNHLVTDLLSLARIEEHRQGLARERVDLWALLVEAVRLKEVPAASKKITCTLDDVDERLIVMSDREGLTQVIDNLLDNAIKYTPEGGKVRITTSVLDDTVLLEFIDNGIGIPAEDLERVFERFYRVDKARSRAVGGTGLGLSIVKHLVSALGGQVDVESEVGVGTTFTVRLPLG